MAGRVKKRVPVRWRHFGERLMLECPGCKTWMRHDHEIKEDGTIEPSLDCPLCDFHKMARLGEEVPWTT